MKFRRKPTEIEAWQFRGDATIPGVCNCQASLPHVHTAHAGQTVDLEDGDWITAEPSGRGFYPIKPDIFAATYDEVKS